MVLTAALPVVAAVLFINFLITVTFASGWRWKLRWLFPSVLSASFLLFSMVAVVVEGPTGFWDVHTQSLWGNQVWFDLLLAAGLGWSALLPQMKAVGMRPLPWLLLVVLTGSIGLLAMTARLNYLLHRTPEPTA